MLEEYFGASCFQAWHGDLLVGWIGFRPEGSMELDPGTDCICEEETDEDIARITDSIRPVHSKTLRITCVQVRGTEDGRYRRKGIGQALVRDVIGWAKAMGYERIVVGPVYPSQGGGALWHEKANESFWASLGFRVASRASEEQAKANREKRRGNLAKHPQGGDEWPLPLKVLNSPESLSAFQASEMELALRSVPCPSFPNPPSSNSANAS